MLYDDLVQPGSYICHYGVKGQKWGKITRKYEPVNSRRRGNGKTVSGGGGGSHQGGTHKPGDVDLDEFIDNATEEIARAGMNPEAAFWINAGRAANRYVVNPINWAAGNPLNRDAESRRDLYNTLNFAGRPDLSDEHIAELDAEREMERNHEANQALARALAASRWDKTEEGEAANLRRQLEDAANRYLASLHRANTKKPGNGGDPRAVRGPKAPASSAVSKVSLNNKDTLNNKSKPSGKNASRPAGTLRNRKPAGNGSSTSSPKKPDDNRRTTSSTNRKPGGVTRTLASDIESKRRRAEETNNNWSTISSGKHHDAVPKTDRAKKKPKK